MKLRIFSYGFQHLVPMVIFEDIPLSMESFYCRYVSFGDEVLRLRSNIALFLSGNHVRGLECGSRWSMTDSGRDCILSKARCILFETWHPEPNTVIPDDPDMWFLPQRPDEMIILMERSVPFNIPCLVSNPDLQVTLLHVETNILIDLPYNNKQGFFGKFNDGTYVCKATLNGVERESEEYIVETYEDLHASIRSPFNLQRSSENNPHFSNLALYLKHPNPDNILTYPFLSSLLAPNIAPDDLYIELHASSTVVKLGEPISVTCTANTNLLDFKWNCPRLK
eukprot:g44502.t1